MESFAALLVSFGACYLFTGMIQPASAGYGALWAAISGMVVLRARVDEAVHAAGTRILGTLVGALIGAAYLALLPFNAAGLAAAGGLAVLTALILRQPDQGRAAGITVLVVVVVDHLNPGLAPGACALLRFCESAIGSGLAVAIAWLFAKVRIAAAQD